MFELVFLGTSASAPSIHRGLPSLAVLAGEHRYLVDCGEGTQRQILRSGIGFKRLNRILLTHAHLDHILGLGGLISTFANFESVDFIEIYGGKPALDRVDTLLFSVVLREERNPMPISLVDIHRASRVLDARTHEVYAFPVQHRGPGCFGFEFREHAHRPFLAERAAELGVPTGPERGMLVREVGRAGRWSRHRAGGRAWARSRRCESRRHGRCRAHRHACRAMPRRRRARNRGDVSGRTRRRGARLRSYHGAAGRRKRPSHPARVR